MKSADKLNLVHCISILSLWSLLFSPVTGQTKSTDVEGIELLINSFPMLGSISPVGDPCLPAPYAWVTCSSDDTPRITALYLGGPGLIGTYLPDFSAMDALEIIDLSNNVVAIEFPDFLAKFPKLKVLNLANLPFSGTVPTSLEKKSKNKTLQLTLTGLGTTLCYSDEDACPTGTGTGTGTGTDGGTPSKGRKKKTVPIVLGTVIPVFVIFWAIVAFLAVNHQKRKAAAAAGQINGISGPGTPMYGNTMSPNPLLHSVDYQDLGIAAQNIVPDDHHEVNIEQQAHQTVEA